MISSLSSSFYSTHPRANFLTWVKMRKDIGSEILKCYLIPPQFGSETLVYEADCHHPHSSCLDKQKVFPRCVMKSWPPALTPTSARSGRLMLLKGSTASAQLNMDCCCFVQSSPYDRLHLAFSGPTQMVRVTNRCLDFAQPTHWCHKKRLIPLRWVALFVCIPTTTVGNATMGKKLIKEKPNFVLGATDIKCDV